MAMNQIVDVERLNLRELEAGTPLESSWHWQYRQSHYVYIGGLSQDLTEGDVETIMAQWGIITDLHLVRDEDTGKSKVSYVLCLFRVLLILWTQGFAFVSYADWRSTVLAVDNFNGTQLLGRKLKVDHVLNYMRPDAEKGPTWWDQKQEYLAEKLKAQKKQKKEQKKLEKKLKKDKKKDKKKTKKEAKRERDDRDDVAEGGGLMLRTEKKHLVQGADGAVYIGK